MARCYIRIPDRPRTKAHHAAAALAKKPALDAGCQSDHKIEFSFLNSNLMVPAGPANISAM
jgi:hypothetical protein